MGFLYILESIRLPVLNEFMLLITQLGEETAFLVIALILFWCVDKYRGYYILAVGFLGTVVNQFLKLLFRIPRPWVIDENFTILESAKEAAAGYSFPSGHTQCAVGTFGGIAYTTKNRTIGILACILAILVAFSRMYIGVHTPLDVLTSVGLALLFIIALRPVIFNRNGKGIPVLFCVLLAFSLGFLAYVELFPFPNDIDAHNLLSGRENAYTLLGALLGLLVVYMFDTKWLNFSTKAIWWAQIIKVVMGLCIILTVKSGLKAPLNAAFGEFVGRAVRYFFLVIVAGILWPLSFRWFEKFGKKKATGK